MFLVKERPLGPEDRQTPKVAKGLGVAISVMRETPEKNADLEPGYYTSKLFWIIMKGG